MKKLFTDAKEFKGILKTSDGKKRTVVLDHVPMDDLDRANKICRSVMGFKMVYGLTQDGKVIAFYKGGKLSKRDFKRMASEYNVVACASHLTLAPTMFRVGRKQVKLADRIILGGRQEDFAWLVRTF